MVRREVPQPRRRSRFGIAAAIIAGTIGIGTVAYAGVSSASTGGCTGGAFSGYCGTQVDAATPALGMVSAGQAAIYNNHVNTYPNTTDDPGNDFVNLWFQNNHAKGVEFMYAPNGKVSGLCVSDPNDASLGAAKNALALRWCNGSGFQRWVVSGSGPFVWTNVASGKIMQANGQSKQMTDVTAPIPLLPTQEWTFAG